MYRGFGKRCVDLVVATIGLVSLSPVFIIVSVFIKIDSSGPVFFRQRRMGQGGRVFFILKFRSMVVDLASERKEFDPGSVSRVTRFGKFLRQTKIDEIPQLINVLLGDMSLVGPRPEVERYKDSYTGPFAEVLSVRPGITDLASIKYRREEEILSASSDPEVLYRTQILPDKLQIALVYIRSGMGFVNDMKIIGQSIVSVVKSC